MTILVLYEELAGYFLTALSHYCVTHDAKGIVIHKKVNEVAPFKFDKYPKIQFIPRESLSEAELSQRMYDVKPDTILCGGWSYKPYLKNLRAFSKNIPVILAFDNQWTGALKQILGVGYARTFFKNKFNKIFVPGEKQKSFALKMGFNDKDISTGFYCCDYPLFSNYYQQRLQGNDLITQPKTLLYMGRYAPEKAIEELWQAFIKLNPENWELKCIGKGDIEPIDHPKIKHLGFIQPKDLGSIIAQTDAFILPSFFEPWGVVVHELATAGVPLLCSSAVGASEAFIEDEKNGFLFDPNIPNAIYEALRKLFALDDSQLEKYGNHSRELSKRITNETWSNQFHALVTNE